ncbi:MAG TPA: Fe2+-dependent dioxygenase [Caulobacteraceae bacterium]|jgi:PKHD-type hydroxylase
MFLEIPDILTPPEIERLRQAAKVARFVDGRTTNAHSPVKNNTQLDYNDPNYRPTAQLLHAALTRSEELRNFAFPKVIAPPLLTRTGVGMNYGAHSDAPFMNIGQPRMLRSDLSCTIFLGDPTTYEGGELSIQLGARGIDIKLPPGGAVVYPSTTLHQVKPVTSGERLVAITFIESQIVDQNHRELLYELNEVLALEGFNVSWENRTRLSHVSSALHRMWGTSG